MIPVTLILLAGLAGTALLHRSSAAARHWMLTTAIVCALAMPVMQRFAPAWLGSLALPWPHSAAPLTFFVTLPNVTVDDGSVAVSGQVTSRPAASVSFWFVIAWIVGSALSAAYLLIGMARVAWLAKHSSEHDRGPWRDEADALSRQFGLTRRVRVLQSRHPRVLITWGWRRASVLLPSVASGWSAERIRIVLAHELAHVRRRDWLALLAGELLRCAHWFNPAVWAACRTLRRESELACDDEVLNVGIDPRVYAEHLLDLVRTLKPQDVFADRFIAPAMARPSTLERRVRAMLDSRLNRTPVSRRLSVGALTVIAVVAFGVAALFASNQSGAAGPSFSGTLLDAVGRPSPDIAIVVTDARTHDSREARTDQSGHFLFANLAPGEYDVKVQQPGFQLWSAHLTIRPGEALHRDISLQLGEVREMIVVRAVADGATAPPPPPAPPARPSGAARSELDPCNQSPVGGCVVAPRKIRDVKPVYPDQERRAARDATVKIAAVIGTDGKVRDMRPLSSGDGDFIKAAMEAISQWEFTATRVAGVPVDTNMSVTVNFEIVR